MDLRELEERLAKGERALNRKVDVLEDKERSLHKTEEEFERAHREALIEGDGNSTVPCLRIEHDEGKVEWMYESDDIIQYLAGRFAG